MSVTSLTGRVRGRVEALAAGLSQQVESVTRNSRIFIENSDVDDLNPPDDIDEYHDLYREVGIIRANINQFVRDVTKPGVRIEADDETTQAYFMGGEGAPDFAPTGGFIDNCAVIGGEKHKPFYPFLGVTIAQRWTRGTNLIELLKQDGSEEKPDGPITGFKHIPPETVSARTYANTNILLDPDDTKISDEVTKRGEAAAYVQFDDNSIVGRRIGGFDKDEITFSQNDILKQVLNPDIGGDDATEDGVFGTSIIESCATDAEEYQEIKRDRARAVKTKAYGVWDAQFNTEVTETPDEVILTEWSDDDQDDWLDGVEGLGPGDIIGHDGSIELNQWEPSVPDLDDTLKHYVSDILAPLPAPKYATAFGESIANHVSDRQENSYQDTIEEERKYQSRSWTQAFRAVAERHPKLDPSGVRVLIEPEEEASPVMSLDDDDIERLERFANAFDKIRGDQPTDMFADPAVLLQMVLQLPEEALPSDLDADVDESDPEVQAMAEQLTGTAPAGGDD
ncbi:hypothetical protein C5C07_15455 [Haloferax sp. Atlit-4N]|uniref:hypothetical protein n=1 Tax=Haloferax sp. Atlit-4N TaxID=2077206 RepID=UPI000E281E8C|nr:hypothetical protein [Haloferax sp. Atlit-4N]RDZ53130.1 hypothetical protein C5C07_15455 [Haloferax sp. Atlit-4N]